MSAALDVESLQREVVTLRERVAELQRRAARYDEAEKTRMKSGFEVSTSEREELLIEAERIIHMGSWVWNVESDDVFWSDELFRILGLDPETDQASSEAFFARVHPGDRERVQTASRRGIERGVSEAVDYRVLRPDGTVRHVTMDGALLFDDAGKLRRVVGTVLDVTAARNADRELAETNRLLEEAQTFAQLGSWSLDLDRDALTWSNEFHRILGVAESATPSVELFQDRLHADDRDQIAAVHARVLETGEDGEADARIVRPDGEVRHVRIKGMSRRDESGRLVQVRGTMLDVTDLRTLQERLARSEKMEAVGRLAGGIAHDFNNLLMVMTNNVGRLHAANATAVGELEAAIESAATLTKRLLAFGRQAPLRPRPVSLNAVVDSTLDLMGRVIGEHIQIQKRLATDLPPAELDKHLMSQALMNLLLNARDAMPDGGVVMLSTRVVDVDGARWVELSVEDDGPGVSENVRHRIFEPFFTTKATGEGSGLGLSMVHGTVLQHGGTITLEPPAAGGSRFDIRFPEAAPRASTIPAPRTDRPERAKSMSVLVVEDQPAVAKVLRTMLETQGHRVECAERPSQAISMYEPGKYDLVVCDLVMPEMLGPALVAELGTRGRLPEIIFVSGYGAAATDAVDAKYQILSKPFTMADFTAAIEQLGKSD